MSNIEKRLEELNINLSQGPSPVANYVSMQRAGDVLYFSGAGPIIDGKIIYQGRLGENISIEEGYDAAKIAAINLLAVLKREIGDLDKVEQIVKVLGFVSSTNDFYNQPAVIDGASDLLVEVFGDNGRHARCAVGTNVLPMNLPVEVDMIVKLKSE
ncbi:MAG: RidA family protein [Intestinibacter sp.]|uniref:RidA family protein n=1 Tax=Intestinibacter sp. TaxID=1965304 RepID=UPI003F16227E